MVTVSENIFLASQSSWTLLSLSKQILFYFLNFLIFLNVLNFFVCLMMRTVCLWKLALNKNQILFYRISKALIVWIYFLGLTIFVDTAKFVQTKLLFYFLNFKIFLNFKKILNFKKFFVYLMMRIVCPWKLATK